MSQDRPVSPNQPLPVHRWPLDIQGHRFTLGRVGNWSAEVADACATERRAPHPGVGIWQCELDGEALTWSDSVYNMFGLPRGVPVTRAEAVTYYSDHSRAQMERLRADAIEHQQSFLLDAEIRPGHGSRHCWMRLIAAPVCEDGRVVRLQGLKQILA